MMIDIVKALALTEIRLRLRRTSTVVALLVVVAISWVMIADPAGGTALLVSKGARALYTSSTLSIGSAALGGLLFSLAGFYLVRGRMAEDIRSGTGSVIGATPVGNALFLFGRWLGAVAYLCALILGFMLTIMVLHLVRGDGPIQPLIYLQNFTLMLLPMVLFTASVAILFDSWNPLMGKGGDVLFFIVWTLQLGAIGSAAENGVITAVELIDFNGMGASMIAITEALGTKSVALGGGDFKAALPPLRLPDNLWPVQLVLLRVASCLVALLPALAAAFLFHRFSPDKVKVATASKRRTPLEVINTLFKPLARCVSPLFVLAARIGGFPGQVLGDVALTLAAAPFAILAVLAAVLISLFAPAAALGGVALAAVVFWGVLVSDLSTRDFSADTEDLSGAVHGGISLRLVRQYAATLFLGLMFAGVAGVRWATLEPMRALALLAGVLSFAALASAFGRLSRTARLFMALFLFWVYVSLNAPKVALIDAIGFLNAATPASMATWLATAALAFGAAYVWNQRDA